MSSGERAKPPESYEERNPFDISRRSQTEVVAELAKRMAALKQARGRSSATPRAAPASDLSPGAAKPPPLTAPVQPPGAPDPAEPAVEAPQAAEQGEAGAPAGHETRAPFLASFSLQRAMPPAPSPEPPAARAPTATARQSAVEIDSAARQGARRDESVAEARSGSASPAAPPIEAHHAESRPSEERGAANQGDRRQGGTVSERESRASLTMPAAAGPERQPVSSAKPKPHLAPTSSASEAPAISPQSGNVELRRAKARDIRARWMAARDFDGADSAESARDDGAERKPAEPATPDIEGRDPDRQTLDQTLETPRIASAIPPIEVLDEISGRREPMFDTRAAEVPSIKAAAAPAIAPVEETGASLTEPSVTAVPPIEALDELSGRREPTFDVPVDEPRPIKPSATEPRDESSNAGDRVAAFHEPAGKTRRPPAIPPAIPAAESQGARRRIEPPAIQTRIEARRIDALRADPQRTVRRPVFPHIDPEDWQVPPAIAARARRERRGTGWAISLGAALLIVGITAPAAIMRHGREEAPVDRPNPPSPSLQAETSQPPAPAHDQPAAQPTSQGTPRQQATRAANPPVPEIRPGRAAREEQAALGPVRRSGELADAPVSAPPPPWMTAQVPRAASHDAASRTSDQPSPMVARPFVPDQAPPPFLNAPTEGTASVAIDGGPDGGAASASISLKPNLIPKLKPKVPAAGANGKTSQQIARKPKPFQPPSLEQMFQTLVNTLSEGQPPNPASKPIPPSTRK